LEKILKNPKKGKPNTCKVCGHQFRFTHKDLREEWVEKRSVCPDCQEPYCNKPTTERILMKLQDEYFEKDRDRDILNKITKILIHYAENLIKKNYSFYVHSYEDIRYAADNTVYCLLKEFLEKPHYKVWGSWAGALKCKIPQALFGNEEKPLEMIIFDRLKKKIEKVHSIDYILEDGNYLEIEDPSSGIDDVDNYMDKLLFHDFFMNLFLGFTSRYTVYECMFMIYGVYLQVLDDDPQKTENYFSKYERIGKQPFLKFNEIIDKESRILK
jgi:hypothetical protein